MRRCCPSVGRWLVVGVATALLGVGCGKSKDSSGDSSNQATVTFPLPGMTGPRPNPPVTQQAALVIAHAGTIVGVVHFTGPIPQPIAYTVQCADHTMTVPDQSIVVNPNRTLADVVVHLLNGPAPIPPPQGPAVLDQKGCMYVPHVLALQTNQTLRVYNSDDTIHNVHGYCVKNPPFNIGQAHAGSSDDLSLAYPETFAVKCDVHPWMLAYVHVLPDPWFAVTDKDGAFTITNVPPGTYHVSAEHDLLGKLDGTVTVPADGKATVDFTYAAPPMATSEP